MVSALVANLLLGVTLRLTVVAFHSEEVEIFPVASCYRNRDKLRPGGPLCLYPDFTI